MILGIYGYGGLGREILEIAKKINSISQKWVDIIFIDDNCKEKSKNGINAITYDELCKRYKKVEVEIIVGIGEPSTRKSVYSKLKNDNFRAAILIHPSVDIPDSTDIEEGVVICANAFISCNSRIGKNSYIQPQSLIGHDCIISEHVIVSPGASVAGGCSIGEGSYIGMKASIKEGTSIGSWVIVGMASSVYKDIDDSLIVMGSPARVIQKNDDKRVFR